MDWRLFATTFGAVFLAEMGDKTQLATMSLTATSPSARWVVFAASALALVAASALAVLVGDVVSRWISPTVVRRLAGAMFLVIGLWLVLSGAEAPSEAPEASSPDDEADGASPRP